ncbi:MULTISPECIES: GNAT family N-acetyltransferase [Bacillus]|uniref:GNAT family N-acetyltransferase n=1 Tax=Bacillus cereus TaxID=1396 RepID=A0A2C1M024_BACCE|nr:MULTISPECIES: GNAT family N-acetyltransferase [Bacillus]MDH4422428.1 GNAT family N-acetyltransferase [Bacillus cereus]PER24884.1 GNAT family N-acetyltransferase [Bacillus cereus]PFA64207.1 GNAT family N-acetyltransferase [Bacillus sp. AFS015896]PGL77353.1 GNAT family N-acetyltransferase [Bacillus sp. AFS054943]PGU04048.1 GNAT family N-acetyltransferase [Bacillus cereus]
MITFEKVTVENESVVKEMFSSHSLDEKKVQYCVKVDDTYIGVIDYSVQEESAVLSQLIIHFDYQGYGYGTNTYFTFEEMMKQRGIKEIKVLQEQLTEQATSFIESFGFIEVDEMYVKKI